MLQFTGADAAYQQGDCNGGDMLRVHGDEDVQRRLAGDGGLADL